MKSRWQWLLTQLTRRLWFRAGLLSLLAVTTALIALAAKPLIPSTLSARIGAEAVDNILNILATSMLAVTTFSLTTMVSAYGSATNNVTPRATRLLIEDPTSQNVLATFIGSFLYSLVGIIALSTGAYGEDGRVILFGVTIAVIALIVVTLLRWIDHLAKLGRVGETTKRVEQAVLKAVESRARDPYLGGKPLVDPQREISATARPLHSARIGYVQYIDMHALSEAADMHEANVYVTAPPGTFVEPSRPLAWLDGFDDETFDDKLRGYFAVAEERSFDQDPRFGMSVLAEIAARALSPAMNDMGTAIDVIGRSVRILALWSDGENAQRREPTCERIFVPEVRVGDMFDDVFTAIGRDGAGLVEVQIRLQKGLLALASLGDERFAREAARHSRMALERAEASLPLEAERARVRDVAALVLAGHGTATAEAAVARD